MSSRTGASSPTPIPSSRGTAPSSSSPSSSHTSARPISSSSRARNGGGDASSVQTASQQYAALRAAAAAADQGRGLGALTQSHSLPVHLNQGGAHGDANGANGSPGPFNAQSQKRARMVREFLRQGEENQSFRVKAPMIIAGSPQPLATSPSLDHMRSPGSAGAASGGSGEMPRRRRRRRSARRGQPVHLRGSQSVQQFSSSSVTSTVGSAGSSWRRRGLGSDVSFGDSTLVLNSDGRARELSSMVAEGELLSPGQRSPQVLSDPEHAAEHGNGRQAMYPMPVSHPTSPLHRHADEHDADETRSQRGNTDGLDEDFMTVDWARDRDMYLKHLDEQETKTTMLGGFFGSVYAAVMQCQGWLICILVGVTTGLLAACIDIAVHWAIDIKMGYCRDRWYFDYAFCCAGSSDIITSQNNCLQWVKWSDALELNVGAYTVDFAAYVFFAGVMAMLCAWLVCSYAPYASGSGIPEVKTILGGVVIKKYLGLMTLLIKCVGLVISVGSGLSLGKEGPYVHIASCLANVYSRYFPKYKHNEAKKNEILSAAASAGVAVAFGAPIGGVLFSLEEVSTYFPHKTMWRAFFCAIVAAATLKGVNPSQTGKLVLFQIDYRNTWAWFEMIPFCVLGVLGGIIGVFFIRMNLRVSSYRKHTALGRWKITELVVVAVGTALISFTSDFLKGSDNSVLAAMFQQCDEHDPLNLCDSDKVPETLLNLLMVACVTLLLTIFTFGSVAPAGLFIPSLLCGAALGRLVGTLVRQLHHNNPHLELFHHCFDKDPNQCVTPGIYALVGAAAVLGGVTRMTVSLVVIMFELTGGLEYILPIMVAAMISKWVGDAFGRRGIYDEYIDLNEYPFMEGEDHVDTETTAGDIMTRELVVITMHGHTVRSLSEHVKLLTRLRITGFPVVTSSNDMMVAGYITRPELERGLKESLRRKDVTYDTPCYFAMQELRFPKNAPFVDMEPWMHPAPIQVTEATPLHRIYNIFKQLGLRYCLVTRFGKLVGIITKNDILQYFHHSAAAREALNDDDGDDVSQLTEDYVEDTPLLHDKNDPVDADYYVAMNEST